MKTRTKNQKKRLRVAVEDRLDESIDGSLNNSRLDDLVDCQRQQNASIQQLTNVLMEMNLKNKSTSSALTDKGFGEVEINSNKDKVHNSGQRHPWIIASLSLDTTKMSSVQDLKAECIENFILKYITGNLNNDKKRYRINEYIKLLTEFSSIKLLHRYTSESLDVFLQQCIFEIDMTLIDPSSLAIPLDLNSLIHNNLLKFGERISEKRSSTPIMSQGLCIKFNSNQYCDYKTCRWKHLCKICGGKHQPRNCVKFDQNEKNFL